MIAFERVKGTYSSGASLVEVELVVDLADRVLLGTDRVHARDDAAVGILELQTHIEVSVVQYRGRNICRTGKLTTTSTPFVLGAHW